MNLPYLNKDIAEFAARFAERIGTDYVANIVDYCEHNEPALALETLVDILNDLDVKCSKAEVEQIFTFALAYRLDIRQHRYVYINRMNLNKTER